MVIINVSPSRLVDVRASEVAVQCSLEIERVASGVGNFHLGLERASVKLDLENKAFGCENT